MDHRLIRGLMATATLVLLATTALSQGPLQKRVDFSINTPYALRMGDYLLPAGNYVLRQVLQNDTNLFALHPQDLTKEPIAMIRTVRIEYPSSKLPEDTLLFIDLDERSSDSHPVLQGWAIPGVDGWEVVGVVEKKSGILARVNDSKESGRSHKLDKAKLRMTRYESGDKRGRIEFKRVSH